MSQPQSMDKPAQPFRMIKVSENRNTIFQLSDLPQTDIIDFKKLSSDALKSWPSQLTFKEEIKDSKNQVMQTGLRPPQIGALHATLAHWTTSNEPATVVMPTGTGKTETMLALLIAKQCERLLVVVPTDPLREQTASKFIELGLLKHFGVVSNLAHNPVVGVLKHKPKNIRDLDSFFEKCNVIVTTMSIAGGFDANMRERIAKICSHLFIDEAHHIAAPTWEKFRSSFLDKPIVQLTATPFRNDGRHVDGVIIYNYPLIKAQEEGYFRTINFVPVLEFNEEQSDETIAQAAITQLKADLAKGLDHILMARVKDIERAKQVFTIYSKYSEYNPILIYNKVNAKQKKLKEIKNKKSRIIVCVDMLGEGYDLPELKIAALHDVHKSLGVTLQFTGRFTRTKSNIGNATFIANIANVEVKDSLTSLYGEDSDWNKILRNIGTEAVKEQIELNEFFKGFDGSLKKLPLPNIRPKMSTVIYQVTKTKWSPKNFVQALPKDVEVIHDINSQKNVLVFVTKSKTPIEWGKIKELSNTIWDLYVVYWDSEQDLLFINSSNNKSLHQKLADSVCNTASLVKGDKIFRCYQGVNRLVLQNVGLNYAHSGPLRYVMYTGIDVKEGLTKAHRKNTFKSNFFGVGYENATKTSVGCSYKGRVWSRKITNIAHLTKWCSFMGKKVLDEAINVDKILDGVLKPVLITERPQSIPLIIEWPTSFLLEQESAINIIFGKDSIPLQEVSIDLISHSIKGDLRFSVHCDNYESEFSLEILNEPEGRGYKYKQIGKLPISIRIGSSTKPLQEWFEEEPPIIRFIDGSYIENNIHITVNDQPSSPYEKKNIESWNWSGIDITKESQKIEKRKDSIQYYLIYELKKKHYSIIFDDDSSGEAADVITMKIVNETILVELFHCKYSLDAKPGARVDDLYAVCGQAQKSIHWKESIYKLISHMQKREAKRTSDGNPTRFEVGNPKELHSITKMSQIYPVYLDIFIVQPGLSKSKVTEEQLQLLGATELYLKETYNIDLKVIGSS